ncbi:MAG: hypothetical protein QXZ09_09200 [Candidatus Methanomethylicaceae archaeon]
MEGMVNVLALTIADTACELYRIYIPFIHLRRHGINAVWINASQMAMNVLLGGTAHLGWDIVVLPRYIIRKDRGDPDKEARAIVEGIRATGAKVVYEADDDLTSIYRDVGGDGRVVARYCDAITVTSRRLARIMDVDIPSYVLPNSVDLDYCHWHHSPDGVLITGSPTHDDDWFQVVPALDRLVKEGVRVACIGSYPSYFRDIGVEHIDYLPYEEYMRKMSEFRVGLAPLSDDPFNEGKSPLKAIEYMANGVIPVCSNHIVYREMFGHAYLVRTEDEWYRMIRQALSASYERRKKNRKWVEKRYSIQVNWKLWVKAYREIAYGCSLATRKQVNIR